MKNRFNNLTSKEWLPFQKSWFRFKDTTDLLIQNILFFTQIREDEAYYPNIITQNSKETLQKLQSDKALAGRRILPFEQQAAFKRIDFAVFDLLEAVHALQSFSDFEILLTDLARKIHQIADKLVDRKFILILAQNKVIDGVFYPFAWLIGKYFQQILSLKDEKIGVNLGLPKNTVNIQLNGLTTEENLVYALYFRKDEMASLNFKDAIIPEFKNKIQLKTNLRFQSVFPSYQIVKPPRRKKNEILHPAKYPEVLIESFIEHFTKPGENVFDPMSGTGSTQLAALTLGRNAYGSELSPFFSDIARERCSLLLSSPDFPARPKVEFRLKTKDAREITAYDFPPLHYIITSPPYWDMLNMKGAENQAKRRKQGLQTNYSDSGRDLGNIADYQAFLQELTDIYLQLYDLLLPGRYLTIIVKNIKKKGRNFPLAWDLSLALSKKFILCPESFWFQDDLRIAPYGYGNTWVSNTFHHYCLTFQKPA